MSHNKINKIAWLIMAGIIVLPVAGYAQERLSEDYTHSVIAGRDRYETGAKIAKKVGNLDRIILVNGSESMADGLSASSLSGKLSASIIPIKKDEIPSYSKDIVKKASEVYIIGGTEAISENVENEISGKIIRIGGKNRFETSKKVAEYIGNYNKAYLVNGVTGEADAMSISSVSTRDVSPIILVEQNKSFSEKKSGVQYTVIGGTNVISDEIKNKYDAERISGATRFDTNKAVINRFYKDTDTKYYTCGDKLIDALSGSYIAKDDGIVLVAEDNNHKLLKRVNTVQLGWLDYDVPVSGKPVDDESSNDNIGNSGGGSVGEDSEPQTAKLEIINETNMLDIKAIPYSKDIALKNITPYTFTIKNSGNVGLDVDFMISVVRKTLPVSDDFINVEIKDDNGTTVYSGNFLAVANGLKGENIMLLPNTEKSFKLWAWIDEKAELENLEKGLIEFRVGAVGNQSTE